MNRWIKLFSTPGPAWIWLSISLYLIACALPAYNIGNNYVPTLYGWECLMMFPLPWWWSNPLYFLSLPASYRGWHKAALVMSIIATAGGVHLELMTKWEDIHIGFLFWMTSMQLVAINSGWQLWRLRNQRLYGLAEFQSPRPEE